MSAAKKTQASEARHTPGPWTVDVHTAEENGASAVIRNRRSGSPTTWGIAGVWHQSGGTHDGAEDLANARLIAAAPELLEALRDAEALPHLLSAREEATIGTSEFRHAQAAIESIFARISAAIAKATGGES